ncbi:hypothetical protein NE236_41885 [Actinoallomurus purpureus]|uniref:hypothetical protein n=1 Tax=Actinoallomurus purpureus TaxID=478114 RepID=UPI0020937F9C|nr:hypothetical protein [Actinoallomurus purpureus]MCO6011522.1 hypothetical protein [Actinoallomurus purpureus]
MAAAVDTDKVTQVMRQFDRGGRDWCGWKIHGSTEDPSHVLITCDVPDDWARTMPGPATQQGIARHLHRFADALSDAGFGIAMWKWRGMADVLIVAANQATTDEIAPRIRAHLTGLNPEPAAPTTR